MIRRGETQTLDRNAQAEESALALGPLRIDGRLLGSIWACGDVLITANGEVVGDIVADNVAVAGTVRGSILCDGDVEITRGGRVEGEVSSRSFSVHEGGVFAGLRVEIRSGRDQRGASEGSSAAQQATPYPMVLALDELERWLDRVVRGCRAGLGWSCPAAERFLFDGFDCTVESDLVVACETLLDRLDELERVDANDHRAPTFAGGIDWLVGRGMTDESRRHVRRLAQLARAQIDEAERAGGAAISEIIGQVGVEAPPTREEDAVGHPDSRPLTASGIVRVRHGPPDELKQARA
jgi:cytoskeletal protein CcmA (bactofilin family)